MEVKDIWVACMEWDGREGGLKDDTFSSENCVISRMWANGSRSQVTGNLRSLVLMMLNLRSQDCIRIQVSSGLYEVTRRGARSRDTGSGISYMRMRQRH